MLETLGRAVVRFRWWIIVAWIGAGVSAMVFLPSLSSVVKNDNSAFLPQSSPSVQAAKLADPFLVGLPQTATMVVARSDGSLSAADGRAISAMERATRHLPEVIAVRDGARSPDDSAQTALVEFTAATGGGGAAGSQAVDAVRHIMTVAAPPGLEVYLTGPLPQLVDQQRAAGHTANRAALISGIFVLALLLIAFRSTLAPLVTLLPPLFALAVSGPVIAESTHLGVQISSLMQLLLTALVLGAGTDYGLFLLFRYRENLRRGLAPDEALVGAVARVGEAVIFSAATVVAALLSLLLATFGLYRGVGPGLALGVVIVLLIELTLFPAIVSVLGRAMFWPNMPRPGAPTAGRWGTVAGRVAGRPLLALGIGGVVLGGLAVSLVAYAPSGFNPGGYIIGSNSSLGNAALQRYFGFSSVNATDVVIELPKPVWNNPQLIDRAQDSLARSGKFSSVQGALNVGDRELPARVYAYVYRRLGPPGDLPAVEPRGTRLPPDLYAVYRASATSISPDGRTLLYRTALRAGDPGTTAALQAIPGVRGAVDRVAHEIGATQSGVAGQAAAAADVSAISASDVVRVAPLVLVVLTVLLALVLRSALAPLYLVASVGLSYLASLGLAVLIFVVLEGQLGVNFTLPFFMFIFIMALGEDYNILVMTRIREEARRAPLRAAVTTALGTTGTTVTSAGLVLAGTFGVLAVTTSGQVRQIGVGLALGILLDTFVVRTLLVPSAAMVLGRWNWWPSTLFSGPPGDEHATGEAPGHVIPTGALGRITRHGEPEEPGPRRTR